MQRRYSDTYPVAIAGQLEGYGSPAVRTMKNSSLFTPWSNTIATPATVDNTAAYTVTLTGSEILDGATLSASFTTDGSATQAELNAGLLAAIRASSLHDYVISTLSSNTITLTARKYGVNYTLACTTNGATTNDLTIGTQTATASAGTIPFGRFVVGLNASDNFDEARLPATASGVTVRGVTLAPRAAVVKDAIGNNAKAEYYANEAMDVVVRNNDATGIWVDAESGITPNTTTYIDCNTSGRLGRITATSSSNLALPSGVQVIQGSTLAPNGVDYIVLVSLNLP
jgi:hypothetical protein